MGRPASNILLKADPKGPVYKIQSNAVTRKSGINAFCKVST